MFVCSVICIWRWVYSRDYLVIGNEDVCLQCEIIFRGGYMYIAIISVCFFIEVGLETIRN